MKRIKYGCFAVFLLAAPSGLSVPAGANCVIRYSAAYVKAGLPRTAGNFGSAAECSAQMSRSAASDPSFYDNARCDCDNAGGENPVPAFGTAGGNMAGFAVQTAVGSLLNGMFAPQQDNSAEVQKQKEDEAAAELAGTNDIKRRKEAEAAAASAKKTEIEDLSSRLKLGDEPGGPGTGADSAPREARSGDKFASAGSYDTSMLSALKRAGCAARFTELADLAGSKGDSQEAKFLAEQSQKVANGEMIDRPCPDGSPEAKKGKTPGRGAAFKNVPAKDPGKVKPGIKTRYD